MSSGNYHERTRPGCKCGWVTPHQFAPEDQHRDAWTDHVVEAWTVKTNPLTRTEQKVLSATRDYRLPVSSKQIALVMRHGGYSIHRDTVDNAMCRLVHFSLVRKVEGFPVKYEAV